MSRRRRSRAGREPTGRAGPRSLAVPQAVGLDSTASTRPCRPPRDDPDLVGNICEPMITYSEKPLTMGKRRRGHQMRRHQRIGRRVFGVGLLGDPRPARRRPGTGENGGAARERPQDDAGAPGRVKSLDLSTEAVRRCKAATALVEVRSIGSGSSVCVSAEGFFVTNHHVVAGAGLGENVRLVVDSGQKSQRLEAPADHQARRGTRPGAAQGRGGCRVGSDPAGHGRPARRDHAAGGVRLSLRADAGGRQGIPVRQREHGDDHGAAAEGGRAVDDPARRLGQPGRLRRARRGQEGEPDRDRRERHDARAGSTSRSPSAESGSSSPAPRWYSGVRASRSRSVRNRVNSRSTLTHSMGDPSMASRSASPGRTRQTRRERFRRGGSAIASWPRARSFRRASPPPG